MMPDVTTSIKWLSCLTFFFFLFYLFTVSDFQYEPWFGSRYTDEDISPSLLELWKDPLEIDSSLNLPLKNEFIPCDFSIRSNGPSNQIAKLHLPRCILDRPLMKFWYKLDETFKLPRANTYFLITVKGGYINVKSCVLTELFVNLLKDELNDILYQVNSLIKYCILFICNFVYNNILCFVSELFPKDNLYFSD